MVKSLLRRSWFFYVVVPLGVLVPVLFVFFAARAVLRAREESYASEQTAQTARLSAAFLDHHFQTTIRHLESISQRPSLRRNIAQQDWKAVTEELRLNSSLYRDVRFLGAYSVEGRLEAIYPPSPTALHLDFSYHDWYKGVSRRWAPYVSEVFLSADPPNCLVVGVAVPILDETGEPVAILMAGHRLDGLGAWLKELERSSPVRVAIVAQRGRLLASPEMQEMAELADLSSRAPVRRWQAGESGRGILPLDDEPSILTYLPIPERQWGVLAKLPVQSIHAPSNQFQFAVVPASILLVAMVVGLGLSMVRATQAAEKRLRAYRSVVKSSADAIIVVNPDLTVKSWNAGAERLYGFRADEMIGRPFKTIVPAERMSEVTMGLEKLRHGEFVRFETERLTKTGERIAVNVTNSAITDAAGHLLGYSAVDRDISRRMRAEEELREAYSKLAGSVRILEDRSRQLAVLGELSGDLQSCLSASEAYGSAARHCQALFKPHAGALFRLNDDRSLELAASWNEVTIPTGPLGIQSCWALRRGQQHIVDSEQRALPCEHRAGEPLASLCLPLVAQGEAIGILYVQRCEGGPFSAIDRELAAATAQQVSLGLGNVGLREKLQEQSVLDPLTGTYNRRYLEDLLPREIRRMERAGRPVGLLMIDVDHFKAINDICGHDVGDAVLKDLAQILQSHVRGEDVVCRFGGEEFCVIMPGANTDAARQRAEMIRASAMAIPLTRSKVGPLTVSIGVAVTAEGLVVPAQLVRAADQALYEAKQNGRNQVAISLRGAANEPAHLSTLLKPGIAEKPHCV